MSNSVQVEPVQSRVTTFGKALALGVAGAAGSAHAAIDVASITDTVSEGVVAAAAIGLAFLAFKAGIAVFRSLRSAA